MNNRGFVFVSPDEIAERGGLGRSHAPRSFEGRLGDSSVVAMQTQQNMNHRIPNLPPFIRSDPSLWFAQIELIF